MPGRDCNGRGLTTGVRPLAGQLAEEFLFVHAVLESLATINEDDGNFVVELPAEFGVGVHVNVAPGKATTAREFGEAFFYNLAQMASFTGVNHDVAKLWHAGKSLARELRLSKREVEQKGGDLPLGGLMAGPPAENVQS
jgi:hypothetical protein